MLCRGQLLRAVVRKLRYVGHADLRVALSVNASVVVPVGTMVQQQHPSRRTCFHSSRQRLRRVTLVITHPALLQGVRLKTGVVTRAKTVSATPCTGRPTLPDTGRGVCIVRSQTDGAQLWRSFPQLGRCSGFPPRSIVRRSLRSGTEEPHREARAFRVVCPRRYGHL